MSKTALKMDLGQLRGSSGSADAPLCCPIQEIIVAPGELDVCDAEHG